MSGPTTVKFAIRRKKDGFYFMGWRDKAPYKPKFSCEQMQLIDRSNLAYSVVDNLCRVTKLPPARFEVLPVTIGGLIEVS